MSFWGVGREGRGVGMGMDGGKERRGDCWGEGKERIEMMKQKGK